MGYRHQFAGRLLFHGNAVLHHLCRKPGLSQLHTVLDLHRGKVRIGRDVEGQCRRIPAAVGVARLHVEHSRRTVERLLDRSGDRLRDRLGIGARVRCGDTDHRRDNLGILIYRKQSQTDESHEYDYNRYDSREYRPVNEKIRFHK